MSRQMITRPRNKETHPGLPDAVKARRTSEQVQAEKAIKEKEQEEKKENKAKRLKALAKYELTAQQKESQIPVKASKEVIAERKSAREAVARAALKKVSEPAEVESEEDSDELRQRKKAFEAELAELDESGSTAGDNDYTESPAGSESDSDAGAEIDVDEPDTTLAKKEKGKKPKRGTVLREEVKAQRKKLASESAVGNGVPNKRKSDADPEFAHTGTTNAPKKNKNSHITGFNDDWDQADYGIRDLPPRRPSSPISDRTSDSAFQFGGLEEGSDDEEEQKKVIETRAPLTSSATGSGFSYRSIAKVETLHSTKALPATKKRNRPSQSSMPSAALPRFTRDVVPLVCDTISFVDPWEPLLDREIVDIWTVIFDKDYPIDHNADPNSKPYQLFKVVKYNVDAQITSYRHRFAEAAANALESDFARRGLLKSDIAGRAAHVQYLLGPGERDDHKSTARRFLWESSDATDEKSNQKKGLFLGYLVVRTFDVHLAAVANIPVQLKIAGNHPVGAMCTAIAAVYRTLYWNHDGIDNCPTDKSGHFSKNNWGDYTLRTTTRAGSKPILVRKATLYKQSLSKLTDEEWTVIGAKAIASRGERRITTNAVIDLTDVEEPESNELDPNLEEGSF